MNTEIQIILSRAIQAFQEHNFDIANVILREGLHTDINNAGNIFDLGVSYARASRFSEAATIFYCLQAYKNDDARIPYNLGLIHSLHGRHQLALEAYELALKIEPNDAEVLINKGSVCNDIKNYALALEVLEKAVHIQSDIPELWLNMGIALNGLCRYERAISAYDKAIELNAYSFEAWSNRSIPLGFERKYKEACESCDQAISLNPEYAEAWYNKGNLLNELRSYEDALFCYRQAIQFKPEFAEAWSNAGIVLYELKSFDEALAHYDQAISLNPEYAEAWSNKGVALKDLRLYEQALFHYETALNLNSDIDWVYGDWLHSKMRICSWEYFDDRTEIIQTNLRKKQKTTTPFVALGLIDCPLSQRLSSEIYVDALYPIKIEKHINIRRPKSNKIRIGYFSADFHNHATSYLMAELFELHDKRTFEIIAISYGSPHKDEMRNRLQRSFSQFIDVREKSDREIAQLTRDLEIDIAIDLKGFTQNSRTGIFSYRAAPIQVNYLGYPGTTGAPYIDYIIADKTLIPECLRPYYSEKIAYLSHSYQVNDRKRTISDKKFTRKEIGLPETGFVFCCFNNNYKILPPIFDRWMKILKAVDDSVLWLYEDNPLAARNLRSEAECRGVDPRRLIFAGPLPLAEHLARQYHADLFLDTWPCNAHTTASDALWADLPVLTLLGQSFASRVAASLLNAIGLQELITSTQEEYEALAIELARNPKKLGAIKRKLEQNKLTTSLFDTPAFAKKLEAAYMQMYQRYQEDLPVDHIYVEG